MSASDERLVVEADGGITASADVWRDAVLARAGYRVPRLDDELVARDVEESMVRARAALHQ